MPMHYKFDMPKHLQGGMHSYATGGQVGHGGAPMPPAGAVPAGPPVPPPAGPPVGGPPPGMGVAPAVGGPAAPGTPVGAGPQEPATPQDMHAIKAAIETMLQSPQMYSQLRQQLIAQGMFAEQDLPPQFNAQVLNIYLEVLEQTMQGQDMPPPTGSMPNMAMGGAVPSSPQQSKPVPIMAHEGEFVIPPNVVRAKGTDFFQQLIDKYDPAKQKAKGGMGGA